MGLTKCRKENGCAWNKSEMRCCDDCRKKGTACSKCCKESCKKDGANDE
jgi:hypothetical protein